MVRVARNSNAAVLLPEEKVKDNTHEFMMAVQHAESVLGWYENLPNDEVPPVWMWPFPDELEEWFDEIKLAREQKYSGGGGDDYGGMMENAWSPDD